MPCSVCAGVCRGSRRLRRAERRSQPGAAPWSCWCCCCTRTRCRGSGNRKRDSKQRAAELEPRRGLEGGESAERWSELCGAAVWHGYLLSGRWLLCTVWLRFHECFVVNKPLLVNKMYLKVFPLDGRSRENPNDPQQLCVNRASSGGNADPAGRAAPLKQQNLFT